MTIDVKDREVFEHNARVVALTKQRDIALDTIVDQTVQLAVAGKVIGDLQEEAEQSNLEISTLRLELSNLRKSLGSD